MPTILDIDARRNVKLDDTENPPIAIVGMIDTPSRAYILDSIKDKQLSFMDRVRITRHALKEWINVPDGKGDPVKFELEEIYIAGVGKRMVASEACMNRLSEGAILKIANEAVDLNFQTEETEKNSATPSTH
jgi:hypothetical protein